MQSLSDACRRKNVVRDTLLDMLGYRPLLNHNSTAGCIDVAREKEKIEEEQKRLLRRVRIGMRGQCQVEYVLRR